MSDWTAPALALVIGYFLGAIPFGILLTRAFGAGDLRQIGSGNIGATNVLRTGRKGLAAATLVLDLLKGTAAVLVVARLVPGHEIMAAGAAFVGHLYPVWLGFRGGKGVATYAGIAAGLHWPLGLVYGAVWIGVLLASRLSSLGGLVAAATAPIAATALGETQLAPLLTGCSLLVFWKHRDNVRRLLAGTEPRIGRS